MEWGADMALLLHPPVRGIPDPWRAHAQRLVKAFGADLHLLMAPLYDGQDKPRFARLEKLAQSLGIATVASALPVMHHARQSFAGRPAAAAGL